MFEESLVESTALLQTHNRWPTVISVAIQAVIAAAILAVPLFHPELIKLHTPAMTLFAPPPPRPPQPPPPQLRVHVETTSAAALSAPTTATPANTASQSVRSFTDPGAAGDALPASPLNLGMGDSGPWPALAADSVGNSSPHVVVATTRPLAISRGVSSGMLLAPITPIYPQIARAAQMEGIVIVEAIISRTGHIEGAHVVSGPAMLQGAALEAVRSASYRPYLLNNVPTEVETTISINFHLSS